MKAIIFQRPIVELCKKIKPLKNVRLFFGQFVINPQENMPSTVKVLTMRDKWVFTTLGKIYLYVS